MKLLALVTSARTQRVLAGLLGEPSHQVRYVRQAKTALKTDLQDLHMVIIEDQADVERTDPFLSELVKKCRQHHVLTLFVNGQQRAAMAKKAKLVREEWQQILLNQNNEGQWVLSTSLQAWLNPAPALNSLGNQHEPANDASVRGVRIVFEG